MTPLSLRRDRAAWLIIAGFIGLALIYSVVNPVFESPDERLHFQYVRAMLDQRALPVQTPTEQTEFHQPPLYYALGALFAAPLPAEPVELPVNSFWNTQPGPPLNDNKNLYLHTRAEDWPYRGGVLTVHVLRWLSIALSVATLILAYGVLREVFDRQPGLRSGALAVMAFNPQFIFISASINNDNLAILLGVAMIAWSVRVVRHGVNARRVIVGGLLIGAAALSKLSSVPLAAVMILAILLSSTSWVTRAKASAGLGAVALALAGWWFARNVQLYGDLTGVNVMLQAWGPTPPPLTLGDVWPQTFEAWRSYWGQFGYGQIALDEIIYWSLAALTVVSLIGLAISRRRALIDRRTGWTLTAAWVVSLLAALVFAAQNPSGLHGRFLLPASIVLALAINAGLHGWVPLTRPKLDQALTAIASLAMFALPIVALIFYLIPTYTPPPLLSATDVRARTQRDDVQFEDAVVLLGHGAVPRQVEPAERFATILCWQALKPTVGNYYVFAQLTGPADRIVAQRRMFTGMGQRLSSEWTTGEIFCDDVDLKVEELAPVSQVYSLDVGFVDPVTGRRLTPFDSAGAVLSRVAVASLAVHSPDPLAVPASAQRPSPIDFGGQFNLIGSALDATQVRAGQTITLTLYWQAARVPDRDYTVFVHVRDQAGEQVTQADAMPNQNRYPTSYWAAGEIVADQHPIDLPRDLPSGTYTINIGWYELQSGARLPMNGDPTGALAVEQFTVETAR